VWAYRGLGLDAVASSVKKDGDKRGQQADHHGDGHPINVKKERVSHCLCLLCVSTRLCHLAACGGGAWSVLSCNVKKWSCWPCAPRCGGWRSKYCARFVVWHAHSALPAWISIGVCHEFAQAYIRATMMCLETSAQNGHLLPKHLPKMGSCYKEIKEASRLPLGSS